MSCEEIYEEYESSTAEGVCLGGIPHKFKYMSYSKNHRLDDIVKRGVFKCTKCGLKILK